MKRMIMGGEMIAAFARAGMLSCTTDSTGSLPGERSALVQKGPPGAGRHLTLFDSATGAADGSPGVASGVGPVAA